MKINPNHPTIWEFAQSEKAFLRELERLRNDVPRHFDLQTAVRSALVSVWMAGRMYQTELESAPATTAAGTQGRATKHTSHCTTSVLSMSTGRNEL